MRLSWLFGATVGLLVLGASAFAQNTSINYVLSGSPITLDVSYLKADTTQRVDERVYAGPFTATVNGGNPFSVYCVDLENNTANPSSVTVQTVAVNTINHTVVNGNAHYDGTPGTFNELSMAAWLFGQYNDIVTGPTGDAIQAGALQVAIWDLIDGTVDFNNLASVGDQSQGFHIKNDGTLTTTQFNSVVSDANLYLNALKSALTDSTQGFGLGEGYLYLVDRTVQAKPNGQDMLGGTGGFHTNASPVTPEGSSLLLLLPGLIPVAVGLRRRRANTPVGE